MDNIAQILAEAKDAIKDNQKVSSELEGATFEQKLRDIEKKFSWHSTVNNYAIHFLTLSIILLYFLSFNAYFRLDDKISANDEKISENHQKSIDFQRSVFDKIDTQTKYLLQRSDADRQSIRDAVSAIKIEKIKNKK